MDHAKSHPSHTLLQSNTFDLSFVCDSEDKDAPTEGLYGPGRTVGKFLSAAGNLIDASLSKSAKTKPYTPQPVSSVHGLTTHSARREQGAVSFDVAIVCDREKENEPVEGLYGPGRTASKFLNIAGRRIDVTLGKAAEHVGYGPRTTAERIRRRFCLIKHSFKHYECRNPRACWECCESDDKFLYSSKSIEKEVYKLRQDMKQLLKYVESNVPLTRKQAADHILELSFSHEDFRALFRYFNAIDIIEKSIRVYSAFRHSDFDHILLSSSRKALASLGNVKINSLLKKWDYLQTSCEEDVAKFNSLWHEISSFLRDKEAAFLVFRVLKSTVYSWSSFGPLTEEMMRCIASCMPHEIDLLEWHEFEDIFQAVFSRIICLGESAHSIAMDYILQFLGNVPRVLGMLPFQKLSMSVDKLGDDFRSVHLMKAAIIRVMTDDQEEHGLASYSKVPEHLQRFRGAFVCPVERAVCDSIWDSPEAFFDGGPVFTSIASYIDSPDPKLRDKAWEYANFFLASNLTECDFMLEALSQTVFSAKVDFAAFKKERRTKFIPSKSKDDDWRWEIIYRYIDENDTQIYLSEQCFGNVSKTEQLKYPGEWVCHIFVDRGDAFSAEGEFPLIAGRNTDGTCTYIAQVSRNTYCVDCDEFLNKIYFSVTEGTKPENLHLEETCPHLRNKFVPDQIVVPVLRYPPDEYPEALFGDGGVDCAGPFTWKPVEAVEILPSSYTTRIVSATEAEESGLTSDDEQRDTNSQCGPSEGSASHSFSRSEGEDSIISTKL